LHAHPGSYFLVALKDGQKPWTQAITIDAAPISLEQTRLSNCEVISGQVRILRMPAPAGCELIAQIRVEGKMLTLAGKTLVWSNGRLLNQQQTVVKTDEQGRYTCPGLERELYRVSVASVPPARVLHASIDTEAPNASADVDVDLARLVVHLRSNGQPLRAQVWLRDAITDSTGQPRLSHDVWGTIADHAEFLIPPGDDYTLEATSEACGSASSKFSVASSDQTIERTLELKPRSDLGELQVEFVGHTREHVFSRASFGLFAVGSSDQGEPSDPIRRSTQIGPTKRQADIVREERAIDGMYRLRDLPAGSYDIVAMPDSSWSKGEGYWRHDPAHVDITPGGVARACIELRGGGRLRLRCDDRAGVHLPATCEVYDAAGSKLDISLFRSVGGSFWYGGTSLNVGTPDGASDVYPNLPEGTYSVHFGLSGYIETARTAHVKVGTTTEVVAVLEKQ
jgi:hypothetical protein